MAVKVKVQRRAIRHVMKAKAAAGKSITKSRAKTLALRKIARDTYQGGVHQKFDFAGDGLGKKDRSAKPKNLGRSGHASKPYVKRTRDNVRFSPIKKDGGGESGLGPGRENASASRVREYDVPKRSDAGRISQTAGRRETDGDGKTTDYPGSAKGAIYKGGAKKLKGRYAQSTRTKPTQYGMY